jgi:hypothetical protein
MFKQTLLIAVVLAVPCLTAHAGVVYNWHQLSPSDGIKSSYGKLEVTDAAWRNGSLDVDYESATVYPPSGIPIIPDSKILNFKFDINAPVGDREHPVEVSPRTFFPYHHLDASLEFNGTNSWIKGDIKDGDIYAYDGYDEVYLGSSASSGWTIEDFGSDSDPDRDSICGHYPCSGATGEWVIDPSTIPQSVPAPGALGLFGFGVLGLAVIKRRYAR